MNSGRPGKYNSARDEVLHAMSVEGWANESSGDVESPSGYFSRISNTAEELEEVAQAFEETIEQAGLEDRAQLIGHFLLIEDQQGFVTVRDYANEGEVKHDYKILDEAYAHWSREDDQPAEPAGNA